MFGNVTIYTYPDYVSGIMQDFFGVGLSANKEPVVNLRGSWLAAARALDDERRDL